MNDSPVTPDYVVRESSIPGQIAAISRILTILIAGFGVLMKLLSAKDMAGVWVWMQTTDGAGFIAAVVAAGTFGASLYKTYVKHTRTVALVKRVDDETAILK